jgi:hypothetical protein
VLKFLLSATTVILLTEPASAALLYQFDYTATSGPIQSFSFNFTSPVFITTPGLSPAMTPFVITDGSYSWTIVQDLSYTSPPTTAGFCFGTSGTSMGVGIGGCTASYSPPNGFFQASFLAGFPTAPGVYPSNFGGSLYLPDTSFVQFNLGTGTLILTIEDTTAVPEPGPASSLALACGGMLLLALRRRVSHSTMQQKDN